MLGLWLFGTGEAGLVNARLGNTPWTVLAQGVANRTSLDIGTATIAISLLVLAGWIPLRQRPGIGTVANVIVIGVGIEVMTRVLPQPSNLAARIVESALAIVVVGLGGALYLTANLGPGPRDGWMTGCTAASGGRSRRCARRSSSRCSRSATRSVATRAPRRSRSRCSSATA